jgi:hypothetical protein
MINAPAKALDKLFAEHPKAIGETYTEHASHAAFIGSRMLLAGIACLVHALIPGLFVRTASNTVDAIIALMNKREAQSDPGAESPAVMMENPSN